MQENLELVLDIKAELGEGPAWDEDKGWLYWVNIEGEKIYIFNPDNNSNRTIEVGQPVGAVVPREKGGLVAALKDGFYYVDLETEEVTSIVNVEKDIPGNRFNDGKCDPAGRFWAGTMPMNNREPVGSLYCLDTDLTVRKMLNNVTVSNGIAWSPDHTTMYYNDTPTRKVVAFDYDLATGDITNKRDVINIPAEIGKPDGMTIDNEGLLWVAHWGGYQVSRWNPVTGELVEKVSVPANQTSSCTFGGEDLSELYITTARTGLDQTELSQNPYSGGLFRYKTNVKGCKTYKFKG